MCTRMVYAYGVCICVHLIYYVQGNPPPDPQGWSLKKGSYIRTYIRTYVVHTCTQDDREQTVYARNVRDRYSSRERYSSKERLDGFVLRKCTTVHL